MKPKSGILIVAALLATVLVTTAAAADQQFPTLDTYTQGLRKNEDGSYTIYFGPTAPEGQESNWLQTVPGKSFFVCLRMYGPTEPWTKGEWRPTDVELVD